MIGVDLVDHKQGKRVGGARRMARGVLFEVLEGRMVLSGGTGAEILAGSVVAAGLPQADLVVNGTVTATTVLAGETTTVRYSLLNQGPGKSTLSTTRVVIKNAAGTVIQDQDFIIGSVNPGQTLAQAHSVLVPSGAAAGTYSVIVVLDRYGTGSQASGGGAADTFTGTLVVQSLSTQADLVVNGDVTAVPTTPGNTTKVRYLLQNLGPGGATPSTTRVVVTLAGGGIISDQDFVIGGLGAGLTRAESHDILIPTGTLPGTYTVDVILDRYGTANQASGAQDTYTGTVVVTEFSTKADLVVSGSVTTATVAAGSQAVVKYTVQNLGPGFATASTTRVVIKTLAGAVIADQDFIVGSLDAGQTQAQSNRILVPTGTVAGTYNVVVVLDRYNTGNQAAGGGATDTYTGTVVVTDPGPDPATAPALTIVSLGQPTSGRTTPVFDIGVRFSALVDLSTFSVANLSLTRNGGANLITAGSGITITADPATAGKYLINGLAGLTGVSGVYTFKINATGMKSALGGLGSGSAQVTWTSDILTVTSLSQPASSRSNPVFDVTVRFSKPVDLTTFTWADLVLKRDGGANLITAAAGLTIELVPGETSKYSIKGLEKLTGVTGSYALTVNPVNVRSAAGAAGLGSATVSWTASILTITSVSQPATNRTNPVYSVAVRFSAPVDLATFTWADLTLTRDGGANLIKSTSGLTITAATGDAGLYTISGFEGITGVSGSYVLTISSVNVKMQGVVAYGAGSASVGWVKI